ncbi:hypothetical protein LS482_16230 [Sinomicrobium kalidii]|uniref:hypothetical protein n=1 Tax=Sinomicrobium kalidii TaxID=2900738 RepID=UPI001E4E3B6F|nr:hypothetical protein [Sinomicrobium kalidii]UGU15221.1 hypothetical protein LS482_16230 [Sinomicrobium kalidii]
MIKATIIGYQSLLDMTLQETGSAENVLALALQNGLSLTEDLKPGQVIEIPEEVIREQDRDVVRYYQNRNHRPATAMQNDVVIYPEGISYWTVNIDFIVS